MASLSTDANGNRSIQFASPHDRKRRTLRLGKVPRKTAESVRTKVEALVAALSSRVPPDAETSAWTAAIPDELAAKLAAVGLMPERQSATLGEFLAGYLERRKLDAKGGTVTQLGVMAADLTKFFGAGAALSSITEADAERFRDHYLSRGLAPATCHRRLNGAKTFFRRAVKEKLNAANPFVGVSTPGGNPRDRQHHVAEADAERLIAVCDPDWRLIVALSRYAGLRCPTEVLSLRWGHVDLAAGRMTVPSPKTEHHPGKAWRVVPIFARLRPYLEEAFDAAAERGAEYVVGGGYRLAAKKPGGWVNCNLRTQLTRLVRRAGLAPWAKPTHNMRASCETDLMRDHPIHVVCA